MSYWDTSALLKLYLEEKDSGQFLSLAIVSADIRQRFAAEALGFHVLPAQYHPNKQ